MAIRQIGKTLVRVHTYSQPKNQRCSNDAGGPGFLAGRKDPEIAMLDTAAGVKARPNIPGRMVEVRRNGVTHIMFAGKVIR